MEQGVKDNVTTNTRMGCLCVFPEYTRTCTVEGDVEGPNDICTCSERPICDVDVDFAFTNLCKCPEGTRSRLNSTNNPVTKRCSASNDDAASDRSAEEAEPCDASGHTISGSLELVGGIVSTDQAMAIEPVWKDALKAALDRHDGVADVEPTPASQNKRIMFRDRRRSINCVVRHF